MDTLNLDLSRFAKITREEYYTTDWEFSENESNIAKELDKLTPYERHNQCNSHTVHIEDNKSSEIWNLWACYFRERFLEPWDGRNTKRELFGLKKQIIDHAHPHPSDIAIDFASGVLEGSSGKCEIENLVCKNFIFPHDVYVEDIYFNEFANFDGSIFLKSLYFRNSLVNLNTSFDKTLFYNYVSFEKSNFQGSMRLLGAIFYFSVSFSNATIETFFNCNCTVFWMKLDFPKQYSTDQHYLNIVFSLILLKQEIL